VVKNILERGFKADAERQAIYYREALSIHPCAPLCAFKLAKHLKISIYSALEFPITSNEIGILKGSNGLGNEWSALTMITKLGNQIIIHNPFHSSARQQSNIMHELAHILCKHEHPKVSDIRIPVGIRHFNELHEEEAKHLGATLQLAKPCLLWAKKHNMNNDEIAAYFNASNEMVNFRLNSTGLNNIKYFKRS
jgi:Zn-dependent peptidase ImmA (M78 family)